MDFIITAGTDIGNVRKTNQDSVAVLIADTEKFPIAFGVICDGMGGLAKGELASATVINNMVSWFKNDLPNILLAGISDELIKNDWTNIVSKNNELIQNYGASANIKLGTTISAILITPQRYYAMNVGDSRIYEIYNEVVQLTEDQTVIARELKYGRITEEQAKNDPRGSVLLQCVGASKTVIPDFFFGKPLSNAMYMLCSDGFRHEISNSEIFNSFSSSVNNDVNSMNRNIYNLIELNKMRGERDNITVALIRTF